MEFLSEQVEPDKVYDDAWALYGPDRQMTVAIEEMSELTKELTKEMRGKGCEEKIYEELADVSIVTEQLIHHFRCADRVEIYRKIKLKRLKAWVEDEWEKD